MDRLEFPRRELHALPLLLHPLRALLDALDKHLDECALLR